MTDEPRPTPPPPALWARVQAFLAGDEPEPGPIAHALIEWVDGRSPLDLVGLLDDLRAATAYPISLHILATAWEAGLPDALAGRVAEDWLGTLIEGMGRLDEAREVAERIAADARSRGPGFQGELGHLLLGWGLRDAAAPLVEEAARRQPGDLSAQFNLGVVQKFRGEWAACRETFRFVLRQRPSDAARWNLGIACTALRDWAGAREAWTGLGMPVPPGEGDYAAPGERTPVRLPTAPEAPVQAEVVWGDRLCPARVRLIGMPRFGGPAGFGDVVLVDGVPVGHAPRDDGTQVSIFEALEVFERRPGTLYRIAGPLAAAPPVDALVADLRARGYAVADWTGLAGPRDKGVRLGLFLDPDDDPAAALAALEAHAARVTLYCPELMAAAGRDPAFHRKALEAAGLTGL